MGELASLILGPLVVPECRRAVGRGWIILVRALAGLAALLVPLAVAWWWWFSDQVDPGHMPFAELRIGLTALEMMAVAVALVMGPAVLAGSLAGEKERGSLGLLLTTRVNAAEIVNGRLAGKLSQVTSILLAGFPALVFLAALAGIGPLAFLAMLAVPASVVIGGGGLAAAFSAIARRGRNALLGVYLLEGFLMMGALVGFDPGLSFLVPYVAPFNPFLCTIPLTLGEVTQGAWATAATWSAIGLVGWAVATWRLRPSCLRLLGGASRREGRRGWWVPPVNETRPMLWKELYIERIGALGWVGRWLGVALVLLLFGGSTTWAAVIAWHTWVRPDPAQADVEVALMGQWIGDRGIWITFLLQLAIGLRAAVAVSSERERGTWDALLTSPLEGKEIVRGKLWGSLFGLKWLLAAALWAWTLTLVLGGLGVKDYLYLVISTITISAFVSAVGVRTSLASPTATRAMSITAGIWLGALGGVALLALIIVGSIFIVMVFAWLAAAGAGLTTLGGRPWFTKIPFWDAWAVTQFLLYAGAIVTLTSESRLRFDRIAGRMAGGELQVAVDRAIHGRPLAPIGPDRRHDPAPEKPAANGLDLDDADQRASVAAPS